MTSPRELLNQAGAEQFFDEDEQPIELMLLPGLDAAGVRELEAELGVALPREIDELVRFARGFEFGPVNTVAFAYPIDALPGEVLIGESGELDASKTTYLSSLAPALALALLGLAALLALT
ncbi:MAG: hypothetical protein IT375_03520 [Polyangiaceae bacterium]|nr:hypothetical protein [Polyangiaceae bacterium]